MAAKQKKGGQPKKKGTKTKKSVTTSSKPKAMGYHGLAMQVCSVTNPFCPQAKGGRWPDNSHTKSVAWSIDGTAVNVSTTATGEGSLLFLPFTDYQCVPYSGIVGDTVTYPNAAITLGMSPTVVARYRVTSWGLKLQAMTPAMTTQGICQIRLFSPTSMANTASIDKGARTADVSEDVPLSRLINQDYHIIPAPLGDDARVWRTFTSINTYQGIVNNGWQIVNVGVTGAIASSAVLRVTCYYNYEFVFEDGQAATMFATAPPANNLIVREASASVTSRIGGVIAGAASVVDTIAKNKAVQYLASFAASAYTGNPNVGRGMMMLANGATEVN